METLGGLHGLVGQRKVGGMDGSCWDASGSHFVEVLVAHDHVVLATLMQHQKRLLKARQESGQILKVIAMFQVCIHHQSIQSSGFHPFQDFAAPLGHGFVGEHDRDLGTIRRRRGYLCVVDSFQRIHMILLTLCF